NRSGMIALTRFSGQWRLGLVVSRPQRGGLVLERLKRRLAVLLDARDQQHSLLGLPQARVALLHQGHTLLVACQGVVEAELPVLQRGDDALQLRHRLLEGPFLAGRLAHDAPPSASAERPADSTRLTIRPPATSVTIQSPCATWPGCRTRV